MTKKIFSLRIDPDTRNKLQHIARQENRSIEEQIVLLIRQDIQRFEAQHEDLTEDQPQK